MMPPDPFLISNLLELTVHCYIFLPCMSKAMCLKYQRDKTHETCVEFDLGAGAGTSLPKTTRKIGLIKIA